MDSGFIVLAQEETRERVGISAPKVVGQGKRQRKRDSRNFLPLLLGREKGRRGGERERENGAIESAERETEREREKVSGLEIIKPWRN